jgi:uncharacterized protein YndB with AHSA1/START domain
VTIPNIIVMVLSAVLAFLLLAYAAPKRYQVKVSRRLPAPPDRVWPYLSDPEYLPRWFPGVTECVGNSDVRNGVGQRRHIRIDRDLKRIEREEEATGWIENQYLVLEHAWEKVNGKTPPWTEGKSEYKLEAVDGGTELTGWYTFSGHGTMGRIFSLLSFRKKHEKVYRLAFDNLEKRIGEDA